MNANKLKKTDLFFQERSTFELRRKKLCRTVYDEHFSLLKLTQFEKTGSIPKSFISLGNLIINFHFRNQKSITFDVTFTFLLFDRGVCLPFNNGNALNLKKKVQVKPRKTKTEREQI